MSGIIDVGGERIVNVGEPTNDDHAATKAYVDNNAGGGLPDWFSAGDGPPSGTPSGSGLLYFDTTAGSLWAAVALEPDLLEYTWICLGGNSVGNAVDHPFPYGLLEAFEDIFIVSKGYPKAGATIITDTTAYNGGTGNGIIHHTNGIADGGQTVQIQLGSSGQYTHTFLANGVFDASAGKGIKFPTTNPHVAGAWYDNNGVLTKSAG